MEFGDMCCRGLCLNAETQRARRKTGVHGENRQAMAEEPPAMIIESKVTRIAPMIVVMFATLCVVAPKAGASMSKSGFVTASDGAKIHYVESGTVTAAGGVRAPSILFIPGWTMPAWIWQQQIDH